MMQFELWLNGVAEGEAVLSGVPGLALAIATESELRYRATGYRATVQGGQLPSAQLKDEIRQALLENRLRCGDSSW